jgi:hypothetical protein
LNDAEVRYLIVGGLAVVAHGYVRYTQDIDIVLQLQRENVLRAMSALDAIGYRPLIPVPARDFADEQLRGTWIRDKGMIVFQMLNHDRPSTRLDIFVREPFAFDAEYARAKWEILFGERSPVVHVEELLRLKRECGRPTDLADVEQLEAVLKEQKGWSHG